MEIVLTKNDLIKFEEQVAELFNNKQIRAPIHLYFGNEDQMIEIFKNVKPNDYCVCSWRSHYQCLLKGMPPEKVKEDILAGRSIEMCNKEYKVFSSAIVGGHLSIGVGIALDIKRKGLDEKVWVFCGDMTATTGNFHEAYQYAKNHFLPITFIVEDNGRSVCTPTRETWNKQKLVYEPEELSQTFVNNNNGNIYKSQYLYYYKYNLHEKYPHAGPGGARIQF